MSNPMNLTIPVPTATPGPEYAQQVSTALEQVANHDHTLGKGVQIPSDGLDLQDDLPFNGNAPTDVGSVQFRSLAAALTSIINALYVVDGDAYFTDGQGRPVRITQNGAVVNGVAGNIQGLVDPASASYSPSTGTFTWQKGAGVPAAMDFAQLVQRNPATPTNAITRQIPSGLAASYVEIVPGTVPGSTLPLIGIPSASTITYAFQQIVTAMIADAAVTNVKTAFTLPTGSVTLAANWSGFITCTKDVSGIVRLQGSLVASAGHGTLAMTLPTGFRPPANIHLLISNSLNSILPVVVASDGTINTLTANSTVYFDAVTFVGT